MGMTRFWPRETTPIPISNENNTHVHNPIVFFQQFLHQDFIACVNCCDGSDERTGKYSNATYCRNLKMASLWQAKEEAKLEVENHRSHLEYQYQRDIIESGGSSDSTVKRLDAQTKAKIQSLKESASKVSPEIVKMLLKYITTART